MNNIELEEITLIGLSLGSTTNNTNGQSGKDCGTLWATFEKGKYAETIPEKLTNEIVAVYHKYEGDFTKPSSYFIGVKVNPVTKVPNCLEKMSIPEASYQKIVGEGTMTDCVANSWKDIWNSAIPRAYQSDFEIYDDRSKDWSKAEV